MKDKESSGFAFMGLIFFGSDSEEEVRVSASKITTDNVNLKPSLRKQKKTRTNNKDSTPPYQRQENDEGSDDTSETSDGGLFRYLFSQEGGALPVSGPEKVIETTPVMSVSRGRDGAPGKSKKGWWKSNKQTTSGKHKTFPEKTQSDFHKPKSTKKHNHDVVHPWTKSDAYIEPRTISTPSYFDESRHSIRHSAIQRIQPVEEKKLQYPNQQHNTMGRVTEHLIYDAATEEKHAGKTCKLWPGGKHNQDVRSLLTYEDDDDADSFLEFKDDRQPPENARQVTDKRDLLDRMDSLEKDIQGSSDKRCPMTFPMRPIEKSGSFSDLAKEHKKNRFFSSRSPTPSSPEDEVRDQSGNTESSTEYDREQPEIKLYQFSPTEKLTITDPKEYHESTKSCWPAKSSPAFRAKTGSKSSYTDLNELPSNSAQDLVESNRKVDAFDDATSSKRCFPKLQRSAQTEGEVVTSAADDVLDILERQERERQRSRGLEVHSPKTNQSRQFGGFGMDNSVSLANNQDPQKGQEASVAGTIHSNRVSIAHMYSKKVEDEQVEEMEEARSFDSGWFTLDSLVA